MSLVYVKILHAPLKLCNQLESCLHTWGRHVKNLTVAAVAVGYEKSNLNAALREAMARDWAKSHSLLLNPSGIFCGLLAGCKSIAAGLCPRQKLVKNQFANWFERGDDTFQPDGRCDYRKRGRNVPKRSLSVIPVARDWGNAPRTGEGLSGLSRRTLAGRKSPKTASRASLKRVGLIKCCDNICKNIVAAPTCVFIKRGYYVK